MICVLGRTRAPLANDVYNNLSTGLTCRGDWWKRKAECDICHKKLSVTSLATSSTPLTIWYLPVAGDIQGRGSWFVGSCARDGGECLWKVSHQNVLRSIIYTNVSSIDCLYNRLFD